MKSTVEVTEMNFETEVLKSNQLVSAVALGFEKENASAVIKALEREAGVKVQAR
jgi:rRNA processing protein Krr1/Pno1